MAKKSLLVVKKNCDKLKNNFELKMLQILLRHLSRNRFFFQISNLGNILENFDKKVPKNAKKVIFW